MTPDAALDLIVPWVMVGLFTVLIIGCGLAFVCMIVRMVWESL